MILNSFRFPSGAPPGFDFGNALDFNGGGNVNFSNISIGTGESVTISFWANYGSVSFINSISNGTTDNWIGAVSTSIFRVRWGSPINLSYPMTLTTGVWYHFAVVKDIFDDIKVYQNSILNPTNINRTQTANFSELGLSGNNYNMILDDVGIKKGYAATQTDINNIYNNGSGADFNSVIGSSDRYYHLNESGTDTTAVDSSGNGNDGTLTDFPVSGMWVPH